MTNTDIKTCIVCKLEKLNSQFNKNKNHKDGLSKFCRDCGKSFNKTYYENNKRKSHDKRNDYRKKQRELCKKIIWDHLKSHPCVDCGEDDPVVLEFDHIKGVKAHNICNMRAQGYALVTLMDEINKCVVRCANCHKRKTAKDQNWWKIDTQIKERVVIMDYGNRQDKAEILVKAFRNLADKNVPWSGKNYSGNQIADEIENMTDLGKSLVAVAGFVIQALNSTPEVFLQRLG